MPLHLSDTKGGTMPQAHIVVGLGYGDEGKGSWVDHLVRAHGIRHVIRFNGGAQAMHNVVTPDGMMHGFAQFGSGTLVPGTYTCLSKFMLVEPEAVFCEADVLRAKGVTDSLERLMIHESAPIITPFNRLLNRIQEIARGKARHGSCGFGIGITQGDVETLKESALYMRDLGSSHLRSKLEYLHRRKVVESKDFGVAANADLMDTLAFVDMEYYVELFTRFSRRVRVLSDEEFHEIVCENDTVFEGAQGVLLDQRYGFFPHCTRSNTTFENAEALLAEAAFSGEKVRIGLLRGYGTRHGAGPFVTEDPNLFLPACHNTTGDWQGPFRLGWFDAVAARYALEITGGCDVLAITNLDRMRHLSRLNVAVGYDNTNSDFCTEERIHLPPADYDWLRKRTDAMYAVRPVYRHLPGLGQNLQYANGYVEHLSQMLDHPIHALSTSPDARKKYVQEVYA